MEAIFFGLFGLIVGSFLNVLILREGTDEGVGGRSHCRSCKHPLSALDLVPVLSWLYLRGTCRYCKAPISIQYPLVEALTGLLFFLLAFSGLPLHLVAVGGIIIALTIAIGVYDLHYMLMPDAWNYAFALTSLAYGALGAQSLAEVFYVIIAGPLVAFPLWALWAFSKGRWMGLGDVKFAFGIGWLLGAYLGFIALIGAFIIGALVSVFILLPLERMLSYAQKRGLSGLRLASPGFTMTSEVPFGPFLIASCLTVWFCTIYGIALILPW